MEVRGQGKPPVTGELDESKQLNLEELANSGRSMSVISRKEALDKGLMFYWSGEPCTKGHYGKRRVKGSACVACIYIANQKLNSLANARRARMRQELRDEKMAQLEMPKITPEHRNKVLAVYAETGDLEQAGRSIDLTLAELNVHISRSAVFATEIYALEKRLRAAGVKVKYTPTDVKWTQEKKALLIRAYVDTGDIAQARDAVGASPTNVLDEIEKDPKFKKALADAAPKAAKVLEEIAIQQAIKGNDKLLIPALRAKMPDVWTERLKVDQTTVLHKSDAQLNDVIARYLNKYSEVIDAEFTELGQDDTGRPRRLVEGSGRAGSAQDAEQVPLHLPRQRAAVER